VVVRISSTFGKATFKVWLLVVLPDGIAVFAGLAVQETQLFERFAEDVFAAHCGMG
jgi:hypothetical protein